MWGAYVWAARENSREFVRLEFGGFSTGPVGGLGVGVDVAGTASGAAWPAPCRPVLRIATAGVLSVGATPVPEVWSRRRRTAPRSGGKPNKGNDCCCAELFLQSTRALDPAPGGRLK